MKPFSEIVGSSHKNCVLDLLQFDTSRNFIDSPRCAFSLRPLLLGLLRFSSSIFGGRGRGNPNFNAENKFLFLFQFLQSTEKYLYIISFSFFKLSTHM